LQLCYALLATSLDLEGYGSLLDVNDHRHSVLAMLSLGAVQPHWSCAVDLDGICRCLRGSGCYWHEAGVDTSDIRVEGDRLAWGVES
jgi:hypothetical protein